MTSSVVVSPMAMPLALFSAGRLDHNRTVLVQKRGDLISGSCQDLVGHVYTPGPFDDPARGGLVVADGHGDGTGEFAQGFPAGDRAATIGLAKEAAFRVDDLRLDTAPPCLVHDNGGVRVELVFNGRAGEQGLVDGVLCA